LNLNGGDSWAYYFPVTNPEVLYNFKGEPPVLLKQIAPDFYAEYVQELQRELYLQQEEVPLAVNDVRRDRYCKVVWRPQEDSVEVIPTHSYKKLQDYMIDSGAECPTVIPDWEIEFDPRVLRTIDLENRWINTFQASEYIRAGQDLPVVRQCPGEIYRIIDSICGNDPECIEHFINWLAFIFQYREKTRTAWIFHTTTGTGKNVMFNHVLKPIFGNDYCSMSSVHVFEEKFNASLESTLLLDIDEFSVEHIRSPDAVMDKLKNLVTEPHIEVRAMRTDAYQARNFTNVIITTNHPDPIRLPRNDRRFNVPPYQEKPLNSTNYVDGWFETVVGQVPAFASFLAHYDVDKEKVHTILYTEAREALIRLTMATHETLFNAIRDGDLDYFLTFFAEAAPVTVNPMLEQQFYNIVYSWLNDALNDRQSVFSVTELYTVYTAVQDRRTSQSRLIKMADRYKLEDTTVKGRRHFCTNWIASDEAIRRYEELLAVKDEEAKNNVHLIGDFG
jgi:hypothetical protein